MAGNYVKIDKELKRGRLWRAKEILSGRLPAAGYDAELFGRYAEVLARMHDDDMAGRFYFLSGRRDGDAGRLSSEFLSRRQNMSFKNLWDSMPMSARRASETGVPETVRTEMAGKYASETATIELLFDRLKSEHAEHHKIKIVEVSEPLDRFQRAKVIATFGAFCVIAYAFFLGAAQLLLQLKGIVKAVLG